MIRPLDATARDRAADPENLRLARSLARGMARRTGANYDTLLAAAYFGLAVAARDFDPTRGMKFITPARTRIVGAMLDDLRRDRRARARALPLAAPVVADDPDGPDVAWDDLMAGLSPSSRETLRLIYADPDLGDGRGRLIRVANVLGLTTDGLRLRRDKALAFLRARLEKSA